MRFKQSVFTLYILAILLLAGNVLNAQIQVLESDFSDSTSYTQGTHQDSIFIVYTGGDGSNTITLFADYLGIDSLNFEWTKFNNEILDFEFLKRTDTVKSDTLFYDRSTSMDEVAGGYRVKISNKMKNIDTTFTVWVWYQNFNLSGVNIVRSTCRDLALEADYKFEDEYIYHDLSTLERAALILSSDVQFEWTSDPEDNIGKRTGANVNFSAPFVETRYDVVAEDKYGKIKSKSRTISESTEVNGYPIMIATYPSYSGVHGFNSGDSTEFVVTPDSTEQIRIEAPNGVWFNNLSKNGEEFEWVFYNHPDWRSLTDDSDTLLLPDRVFDMFEPGDSIHYYRPKINMMSPEGYDVKLTSKGPIYNDFGNRCIDTVRAEFVLVDTTWFPSKLEELPNVFSPNGDTKNDYFYFVVDDSDPKDPIRSVRYFSIKIYNRWGNKVYEYEDDDGTWDDDGNADPGWDGRTRVGTKAKPGVYYYAILAEGWNGKEYKVGGYVHIFY